VLDEVVGGVARRRAPGLYSVAPDEYGTGESWRGSSR
jgi:hypothetical protein